MAQVLAVSAPDCCLWDCPWAAAAVIFLLRPSETTKKRAAEWPNEHKASLSEVEKTDSKDFPHVLAPKDKLDLAILDFGTGSSS